MLRDSLLHNIKNYEHFSCLNILKGNTYGRSKLIGINWDGEPSGYSENSDNWIFL